MLLDTLSFLPLVLISVGGQEKCEREGRRCGCVVGDGKEAVQQQLFKDLCSTPTAPCEVHNILAWDLTCPSTFSIVQTEHQALTE